MDNHPAALTSGEIRGLLHPTVRDLVVDGASYVPDNAEVAKAQLIKALEWCANFLKFYWEELPEGDVTRSTILHAENALRSAIELRPPSPE